MWVFYAFLYAQVFWKKLLLLLEKKFPFLFIYIFFPSLLFTLFFFILLFVLRREEESRALFEKEKKLTGWKRKEDKNITTFFSSPFPFFSTFLSDCHTFFSSASPFSSIDEQRERERVWMYKMLFLFLAPSFFSLSRQEGSKQHKLADALIKCNGAYENIHTWMNIFSSSLFPFFSYVSCVYQERKKYWSEGDTGSEREKKSEMTMEVSFFGIIIITCLCILTFFSFLLATYVCSKRQAAVFLALIFFFPFYSSQ